MHDSATFYVRNKSSVQRGTVLRDSFAVFASLISITDIHESSLLSTANNVNRCYLEVINFKWEAYNP